MPPPARAAPEEWRALLAGGTAPLLVAPREVPRTVGHADAAAALAAAGGPPGVGALLVAVNDPDRATRTGEALAAVRAAAPDYELRILVATGTHRHDADRRERHERMLRAATGPVEIRWHSADADDHVSIGGVRLDSQVVAAAAILAIGSVEPHWFAGITGAHKTLTVGVMARADVAANHRHALSSSPRPLRLDGNPVHEGLAAVLDELCADRQILALQHVGDRWIAGDVRASLGPALAAARAAYEVRLDAPAAGVVACVRSPLDRSLYQAEKGIKLTEHAVADGGAILLDAACVDGLGPSKFVELLARAPDAQTARDLIRRDGYRLGDHKAVRWRALQERGVTLGLVSSTFPSDGARAAGLELFADRATAAAWLLSHVGGDGGIVVVDDAAHVVLALRESECDA